MTGESHHLLLSHSLIGVGLSPQGNVTDAFAVGLECGLSAPAILPQLSGVHVSHALGVLPREQVSEFLSDLLIDAEITSICDYMAHQHAITPVVGTSLTAHYQRTFQAMSCDIAVAVGDTTLRAGIRGIARTVAN